MKISKDNKDWLVAVLILIISVIIFPFLDLKVFKVFEVLGLEKFGKYSDKTLFDGLDLAAKLAVPIFLFQFKTRQEQLEKQRVDREKEQVKMQFEDNLREESLQKYIDRMSEILINKTSRDELFTIKDNENQNDSVLKLARIRTVNILRWLEKDIGRRDKALQFLRDSKLSQCVLKKADLDNIDFSGADLSDFNFSDTKLSNTNFSGAILSNANLSYAKLNDANFSGAILNNVYLSYAKLSNANFFNAKLSHSKLREADFSNANLTNANLEGSCLIGTKFINTKLINAKLENAYTSPDEHPNDLELYDFSIHDDTNEEYFEIDEPVDRTDFSGAILTNANFKSIDLRDATNLTSEQLKEVKDKTGAIYNS